MKRYILLTVLFIAAAGYVSSMSLVPGTEIKGPVLSASLSHDRVFNSDIDIFTLNIFQAYFTPMGIHLGLVTQYSPDVSVADLYFTGGFTYYPFEKVFSIDGTFGFGLSIYTLNHFSYLLDLKAKFDIPLYREHHITAGAGVRQRNALEIIGYIPLDSSYYHVYNSYFFEVGYRYILKSGKTAHSR